MRTLVCRTMMVAGVSLGMASGFGGAAAVSAAPAVATSALRQSATQPSVVVKPASRPAPVPTPALRYKLKGLDGKDIDLMAYHGRTLMIVPVAWDSNRRQFEDLELFARYLKDRGFHLIVALTDDFGAESRTDAELVAAIRDRYRTDTLHFAARVKVKGEQAHPLFKYLATTGGGEIAGPFTKFLINRDGEVIKRWEPKERLIEGNGYPEVDKAIDTPMKEVSKPEKKEEKEGEGDGQ